MAKGKKIQKEPKKAKKGAKKESSSEHEDDAEEHSEVNDAPEKVGRKRGAKGKGAEHKEVEHKEAEQKETEQKEKPQPKEKEHHKDKPQHKEKATAEVELFSDEFRRHMTEFKGFYNDFVHAKGYKGDDPQAELNKVNEEVRGRIEKACLEVLKKELSGAEDWLLKEQ
jgi:hypothetical protein